MQKPNPKNQTPTPKKSLGQNFLINQGVIDKIVKAAEINSNDVVLEVGPGTGLLTQALAEKSGTLVAVEKDHRLIDSLKINFPSIRIIEGDALEINPDEFGLNPGKYKVVANIPYYITSHLIRKIFEEWPRPELIVLTVQKEVAKRIVAAPPEMSLLALSVQYFARTEIISYISKGSFRPIPKVDSAIIKFVPKEKPEKIAREKFFRIIKAGFSSKRKTLANNLATGLGLPREEIETRLEELGLSHKIRAEELSLEIWQNLVLTLTS